MLEPKEAPEPELTAAPEPQQLLEPEKAGEPDELAPEAALEPDADYEASETTPLSGPAAHPALGDSDATADKSPPLENFSDAITTAGENTERGTAVTAPGVTDIEADALVPALQKSRANTNEGAQEFERRTSSCNDSTGGRSA